MECSDTADGNAHGETTTGDDRGKRGFHAPGARHARTGRAEASGRQSPEIRQAHLVQWSRARQAHPAAPVHNGPKLAALPDITKGVDRLISAIDNDENFGIISDHDVDGCTAHSVLLDALTSILGVRAHRNPAGLFPGSMTNR